MEVLYQAASGHHVVWWNAFKAIVAAALVLGLAAALTTRAAASTVDAGPQHLNDTQSLAELIDRSATVHIVFVHGIRAQGPGLAEPLATLLERKLGFARATAAVDTVIDLPGPPAATLFGRPIWTEAEWKASRPFVRHYLLRRRDKIVKIDEVNYWPLLFPLKCRYLLVPEHDLAGDDKAHLALCDRSDAPYYSWLRPEDRDTLARKPKGGHAALVNRALKQQIMNWGLSDAVIALGPMRVYLNYAMDRAFDGACQGAGAGDAYVVMSESLGSFVVLDAMNSSAAVKAVVDRADDLYFFANQVPLLELARIAGLPDSLSAPSVQQPGVTTIMPPPALPSPMETLRNWATARNLTDRPKQVIAFSDPSDILTYPMPPIANVAVVNVYDRNTPRWLGLFANPAKAHTGHLQNKAVWKVLMRRRSGGTTP